MEKESTMCSFCGRIEEEVYFLVPGVDDVHICDKCIDICSEILANRRESDKVQATE